MVHGDPTGAGTDGLCELADGRRLQYWAGGAADGPAVMFLPGCPDSRLIARSGDRAARAAGVRLIAVNRPGYGLSDPYRPTDPGPGPGHLPATADARPTEDLPATADPGAAGHLPVADDVAALADRLGIGRFAVLGMSVGGSYALACAVRHPDRVTTAGLVAAPANVPELDPPVHRDGVDAEQRAFVARLADLSPADAVALMRPEFERYVAGLRADDRDDDALAARWTDGAHPADAAVLAALPAADLAAAAREAVARTDGYLRDATVTFRRWAFAPERVRCPVWLWYGARDPQASPRNGAWLAGRIAGATLVVRPDTAHLSTLLGHWPEVLATLTAR
ncbi:alpha/beta fold hydrolase [Jidongwangia harbinensis]|uniref:alpha/beta fold hydrolase n=1 Tax=Jidongwangia harbinensis TaxID=2878561 RepID=UPI001CDA0FAF|nr:alpha/beta hydrolase [Jidongwangia harbinensis]MCA2214010.1 alpha/beta hydrolase [Jidongwangia harbinensis]